MDSAYAVSWPSAQAIQALARGGCRVVQLRAKKLTSREFHDWALEAVQAAKELGISVLVNDRADIAALVGAAGLHIGQDDLSPPSARRLMGPSALIGFSTHSFNQAEAAGALPVDYIAVGPVFATKTKESAYPPLGPEGVARVRKVVHKPLVAIGGITLDNAPSVIQAGADSVAVISGLLETNDLETRAREFLVSL